MDGSYAKVGQRHGDSVVVSKLDSHIVEKVRLFSTHHSHFKVTLKQAELPGAFCFFSQKHQMSLRFGVLNKSQRVRRLVLKNGVINTVLPFIQRTHRKFIVGNPGLFSLFRGASTKYTAIL